jgi:hypothetical protein
MKISSLILIFTIGLASIGASASLDNFQGATAGAMFAGATMNALVNVVPGSTVAEKAVATAGGAVLGAALTFVIGPVATGLAFGGFGVLSSMALGTFNTAVLFFRPSSEEAREGVQKSGQAVVVSALAVAASVVVSVVCRS